MKAFAALIAILSVLVARLDGGPVQELSDKAIAELQVLADRECPKLQGKGYDKFETQSKLNSQLNPVGRSIQFCESFGYHVDLPTCDDEGSVDDTYYLMWTTSGSVVGWMCEWGSVF
uniref:Uncharacterized protein 7 n=1 Tax=Halisarca dujardinii TaxID=2583056 RepID=A0AA96MPK7_HALDU|nr:uncharacterized protein 7 [Halisarca dujardinii]